MNHVPSLSCRMWYLQYFIFFVEYGEKENDQLRERFNINKDDFPVYKLFKQNEANPIDFKGEVKADELSQFIKTNARLWIGSCDVLLNTFHRDDPTALIK